MVYLDGYKLAHNSPPVVGQVISELSHGIILLNLWPLKWVANASPDSFRPLATLWRPELCAMHHGTFAVRGLEAFDNGRGKRWQLQKWICEVLDPIRAREYGKPLAGAMPPTMKH